MTDDTTRKIREHLAATLAILERDITEEKVLSYLKPAQIARALAAAYEEAGEAFRLVGGTDADIEAAARMPAVDKTGCARALSRGPSGPTMTYSEDGGTAPR